MATPKTPSNKVAAPKKAAAKPASKPAKEKPSFIVDKNYILKRFQKALAKHVFPGDENYGDYLALKKNLHENVGEFAQLATYIATIGTGDKAKEITLSNDVIIEALVPFFNDFAK